MNFSEKRINASTLTTSNYISTENMLQDFQGVIEAKSVPNNTNVISFTYGDILISNIRPYLKKVWKASIDGGCSSDVLVMKANDKINNDYLHYVIANNRFINFVMNGAKGVKMPRGDKEQMKTYIISLPPMVKEQNKIATFLSLLDERIATQNKIIEELKQLKICVRTLIFKTLNCSWFLLSELEANGDICLKRGNIIPKHEHTDIFCYPVYSSSVQNGGLMGYNNTYMFNTELVTWSIDGGGNFFYRHKHKFNVTNVSGYMQLNEAKYNYRFVSEILLWQHSFMVFDYQTKAHPSVIKSIYKLPDISLAEQELIANIFRLLDVKLQNEMTILKQYQQEKQYLLRQMFI